MGDGLCCVTLPLQSLSHELSCATAAAQVPLLIHPCLLTPGPLSRCDFPCKQSKLQADRVLQQLRRDVRAGLQALDDQLYAPAFIRIRNRFCV